MKKIISLIVVMLMFASFSTAFAAVPMGGVNVFGDTGKMMLEVYETETDVTATIKLVGEANFNGIAFVLSYPSEKVKLLNKAVSGPNLGKTFDGTDTTAEADLKAYANFLSEGYLKTTVAFTEWDDSLNGGDGDYANRTYSDVLNSTSKYTVGGSINKQATGEAAGVGRYTVAHVSKTVAGSDPNLTIKLPAGQTSTYAIVKFKKITSGTDVLDGEIALKEVAMTAPKIGYWFDGSGHQYFNMTEANKDYFTTTMTNDWHPAGVDTDALKEAIDVAQALLDGATVGSAIGEYPRDAYDDLEAAIGIAQAVFDDPEDQDAVNAAVTALETAMDKFEDAVIGEANMFGGTDTKNDITDLGSFTAGVAATDLEIAGTAKSFKPNSQFGIKFDGEYFPALNSAAKDFVQAGQWSVTLKDLHLFKIPGSYQVRTYQMDGEGDLDTDAVLGTPITVTIN